MLKKFELPMSRRNLIKSVPPIIAAGSALTMPRVSSAKTSLVPVGDYTGIPTDLVYSQDVRGPIVGNTYFVGDYNVPMTIVRYQSEEDERQGLIKARLFQGTHTAATLAGSSTHHAVTETIMKTSDGEVAIYYFGLPLAGGEPPYSGRLIYSHTDAAFPDDSHRHLIPNNMFMPITSAIGVVSAATLVTMNIWSTPGGFAGYQNYGRRNLLGLVEYVQISLWDGQLGEYLQTVVRRSDPELGHLLKDFVEAYAELRNAWSTMGEKSAIAFATAGAGTAQVIGANGTAAGYLGGVTAIVASCMFAAWGNYNYVHAGARAKQKMLIAMLSILFAQGRLNVNAVGNVTTYDGILMNNGDSQPDTDFMNATKNILGADGDFLDNLDPPGYMSTLGGFLPSEPGEFLAADNECRIYDLMPDIPNHELDNGTCPVDFLDQIDEAYPVTN